MTLIDLPEFSTAICPELEARGEDPLVLTRDGFCNACGKTGHPEPPPRRYDRRVYDAPPGYTDESEWR